MCHFGGPVSWLLEKIAHLKVLKIPKFSLFHTEILHEMIFGTVRKSKYAILVILEALNFYFWGNSTFESFEYCQNSYNLTKWKFWISLPRSVQRFMKVFYWLILFREIWINLLIELLIHVRIHSVAISWFLLSLRFYVKSILRILEVRNQPF